MRFKWLAVFTLIGVFWGLSVNASADANYEIHFTHEDYMQLHDDEKSQIILEQPQGIVSHLLSTYRLIYQPFETAPSETSGETETESIAESEGTTENPEETKPQEELSETPSSYDFEDEKTWQTTTKQLPKTNTKSEGTLYILLILIVIVIAMLLKYKKKWQIIFLLVVALGGHGISIKTGVAQTDHLAESIILEYPQGEVYQHAPQEIPGYKYLGYIREDDAIIPKMSVVKVNYVTNTGINLTEPVILTGLVGESYQTEEKEFGRVELFRIEGSASGFFTEDPQEVTYIYRRTPPPETATAYQE